MRLLCGSYMGVWYGKIYRVPLVVNGGVHRDTNAIIARSACGFSNTCQEIRDGKHVKVEKSQDILVKCLVTSKFSAKDQRLEFRFYQKQSETTSFVNKAGNWLWCRKKQRSFLKYCMIIDTRRRDPKGARY